MEVNEITEKVIGSLFNVSNTFGGGFLEKVYENASAIEIAKFSNAKMYAVHVIALGFYSITHSTDSEWEKAMKELITEGKKATTYIENAGRAANVEVESVILEGNPAE